MNKVQNEFNYIFFKCMYLLIHYIKTQQKTSSEFQWYVQDSKLGETDWEKQRNGEKKQKLINSRKEKGQEGPW